MVLPVVIDVGNAKTVHFSSSFYQNSSFYSDSGQLSILSPKEVNLGFVFLFFFISGLVGFLSLFMPMCILHKENISLLIIISDAATTVIYDFP